MSMRGVGILVVAVWSIGWLMTLRAGAGSLNPTSAPAPTMHSLEDIYTVLMNVDGKIDSGSAFVARTGQTNIFVTGDDGYYQKGVVSPNPRFSSGTAAASNCVVDNLTGLMWVKSPSVTMYIWPDAITYCEALNGNDGRGEYSDWRLANWNELRSLIDAHCFGPALPPGHPFAGVQTNYWSSTTVANNGSYAWLVDMNVGQITFGLKTMTTTTYTWPVRGP